MLSVLLKESQLVQIYSQIHYTTNLVWFAWCGMQKPASLTLFLPLLPLSQI